MKESRRTDRPSFIGTGGRLALALTIASTLVRVDAAVIVKENNTNALNLGTSWVGGVAPDSIGTDSVVWNNTVLAANSSALGGNANWAGITIANPGGLVTISAATGNTLTLGTGGIDLSTATQNLTLLSGAVITTLNIGASQTWNVNTGRTLTLFGTSNSLNQSLTGSGNIQVSGAGTVAMNVGDATSTGLSGGGNSGFSGNWTIGNGTAGSGRVNTLRNGVNAWGTGSITLAGGTIAPSNGNWTWSNNISLQSGVTSTIDDANGSGNRTLKLQGVLSGNGGLTFAETGGGAHTNEGGFILTNTNTLSGTVTINSPAVVRVGGVPGNDTTTGAGAGGTLGTASIVNNGTLVLARTNTWTFDNVISGSGLLRLGLTSGTSSHVLTLSGNNSHTGGTTLQTALTLKIGHVNALGTGAFTIAGNGFVDNATGAPLTIGNAFNLSGGSPTFVGTNDITFTGPAQLATANRTITVNAGTVTVSGNITQDATARNLTKNGSGKLILGGTNSYAGATAVNAGTLALDYGTNDTTKLADGAALTLGGGILSLEGASGAHNEVVLSTTLNAAAFIVRNGMNSAEISLGAITRATGGFLDVQGANLANTSTANVNNILQGVTFASTDLAANDGAGNIVAFSGYTDLTRLESGTKAIASDATSQVRIVDGTGSAPAAISPATAGITDVNSLVNGVTGGRSTIDIGAGNTLRLGAAGIILSATGTSGIDINNGTITAGGALNTAGGILISNSGDSTNIDSVIADNGTGVVTLTKTGSGAAVLTETNTFTGATAIRGGTLEVTSGAALADGANVTISNVAGTKLKLSANETVAALTGGGPVGGVIELGANTITTSYTGTGSVLGAAITGTGGFVKAGTGEIALEGNNTFSGTYTVNDGTVAFRTLTSENGKPAVFLGALGNLAIGGEFLNQTATISSLSGSGGVNNQFDAAIGTRTLEIDQAGNTALSGVIRDGDATRILAITKSGIGVLELSGANTYTGATTINGGTLLVSGSLSGSSAVTVNGGTLAGDGPVGAVTLNAGGTVAPGASPATLATGNLNFNGGTLALELNGVTAGTDYDQLSATGGVAFAANTALTLSLGFDPVDGVDIFTIVANDFADSVSIGSGLFSFAGNPLSEGEVFTAGAQDFTISYVGGDGNDIVLAAVPEPGTTAILLAGLAMLGARRRRS